MVRIHGGEPILLLTVLVKAYILNTIVFGPVAQRQSRGLLSPRSRYRNSPGLPNFCKWLLMHCKSPLNKNTIIQVRRILQKMRYHDAVRYSGPIWMSGMQRFPAVYMGEDYEFRDKYEHSNNNPWESHRAFRPGTRTRKYMREIIDILSSCPANRPYVITSHTARWLCFRNNYQLDMYESTSWHSRRKMLT